MTLENGVKPAMDTLGLYVSVPFCRSKCSFCNFASGVFPESYFGRYIDRVVADIGKIRSRANAMGAAAPLDVDSIYLGGGTPSILPPPLLRTLFAALHEEFFIRPDSEVTVECAPGQLQDDVLATMAELGVNRVSFGVQSFVDREAAVTGRLHNRDTALRDIERVRRAGIGAVNVDLIAGLPLQTAASWRESLSVLASTAMPHASIYMFEVDEESRLGSEVLSHGSRYQAGAVPSDDQMAEFYSEAVAFLAQQGLMQYEISNFARAGAESIHNKKYWQRRPYLGFGLDAHSMLRSSAGDLRFGETDDLESYLRGDRPLEMRLLAQQESLEEAWFLGLRLNEGIDVRDIREEFGDAGSFEEVVAELAADGLIVSGGARVRLTDRGRLLSNEVFERFLSAPEAVARTQHELVAVY